MKIYLVYENKSQGYQEDEKYWSTLEKAEDDFNKRLEIYRLHPDLATVKECHSRHFRSEPITICVEEEYTLFQKVKTASIALWYRDSFIDEMGKVQLGKGERSHIQEFEIGIIELNVDVE